MESQQLLAERLVTRQQQAARVATRIGLAHQLEERDDVLIVGDDAVEFLQEIENDIRLPVGDCAAQLREAVQHSHATDVVPRFAQGRGDVVLSPPLFDFLFCMTFEIFRRHQTLVHDHERAHFFHKRSCGVSPWE